MRAGTARKRQTEAILTFLSEAVPVMCTILKSRFDALERELDAAARAVEKTPRAGSAHQVDIDREELLKRLGGLRKKKIGGAGLR